jgi:hypothetical protein
MDDITMEIKIIRTASGAWHIFKEIDPLSISIDFQ